MTAKGRTGTNNRPAAVADRQVMLWGSLNDMTGGKGVRFHTRSQDLADVTGLHRASVQRFLQLAKYLKLLRMESEYGSMGHGKGVEQKVYWTVLVDREEGTRMLKEFFAKGGRLDDIHHVGREANGKMIYQGRRKPVQIEEETVAIVGDDAPKPMESLRSIRKNDAEALIEAARQHLNRGSAVDAKIKELESLGLVVDHDALRSAIQLQPDAVLDAVAQLLPEWDRMDRTVTRLSAEASQWHAEQVELRREVGQLREAFNREKAANQRLSEKNARMAAVLNQ